jgi:hypothetical protein
MAKMKDAIFLKQWNEWKECSDIIQNTLCTIMMTICCLLFSPPDVEFKHMGKQQKCST